MPEGLYLAVFLPKLDVVTIDKTLGIVFRDLVVGANKFDCPEKPAVCPNNARSIPGHLRPCAPNL
jgi:hypothetical protein